MKRIIFWISILVWVGCQPAKHQATSYDFPRPVDTRTKPIAFQDKKVYGAHGVYVSNLFPGARMNDFVPLNDSSYQVVIAPENQPINPSPWYAFQLWSTQPRTVYLHLSYDTYEHRYPPKISQDGQHWVLMDTLQLRLNEDSTEAVLPVRVAPDTVWIAAQEVMGTPQVASWCASLAQHPAVRFSIIGQSALGRPLLHLDIGAGAPEEKEVVVLLSRQHPPEVTGFLALQAFLETILKDDALSREFLQRYRVLVFPLMNPDGVDLGHWRHNAGGIDLNRDWAYYHQPETRQVADYIVKETAEKKSKVLLGLDFHSTWEDVYYTNTTDSASVMPEFTSHWLQAIATSIPNYQPRVQSSDMLLPVSKNWFFTQFGAVGITYEIGDDTSRDFIRLKGKVSAEEMMKLLLNR